MTIESVARRYGGSASNAIGGEKKNMNERVTRKSNKMCCDYLIIRSEGCDNACKLVIEH